MTAATELVDQLTTLGSKSKMKRCVPGDDDSLDIRIVLLDRL